MLIKQALADISGKLDAILLAVNSKPSATDIHQPIVDVLTGISTSINSVVTAIGPDPVQAAAAAPVAAQTATAQQSTQ